MDSEMQHCNIYTYHAIVKCLIQFSRWSETWRFSTILNVQMMCTIQVAIIYLLNICTLPGLLLLCRYCPYILLIVENVECWINQMHSKFIHTDSLIGILSIYVYMYSFRYNRIWNNHILYVFCIWLVFFSPWRSLTDHYTK